MARPRVDEARHSGRVLHQDRRGVPRRHDPFQRRDEIGGLRTRAGLPRGGRRVVLRLPLLAPHEGRRAFGDDSCERTLDLRRLGFDHRGTRGRRRRPETFVHRFAGADRRRADDLPHAVAGEPDPAAPVRSRSGRGGRRGVDRRHDRHHVGCRRVEHDRRRGRQPARRDHQGGAERADRRGGVLHCALPLDPRREGRAGSLAGHRVGEVPQVHPRVRRRVARLQPLPVERSLYVGRQGQTARTGRGEDVLDGLLLAGLRLHRSRHASQGHRLEGEPQRPAVVPRGADIQYRRDVRDRLPALRPAKAGALRTRFQGRWQDGPFPVRLCTAPGPVTKKG